jgi:uncharacterized protein
LPPRKRGAKRVPTGWRERQETVGFAAFSPPYELDARIHNFRGHGNLDEPISRGHSNYVRITYDPAKRAKTLAERGLDFAEAADLFAGVTLTLLDDRQDYGEPRFQTYGLLDRRLVMVVWTPRGADRHVISMRKCNAREKARYQARLG